MPGLGRRLSALTVCAVVAIALLGAAYTLWYEELNLQAAITTGTLDATITCTITGDNESPDWPASGEPYASYPASSPLKDVATLQVLPQTDIHRFEIAVTDAYPGYAVRCDLRALNPGTVAWHLEDIQFTVQKCDAAGTNCTPIVPGPATWTTRCLVAGCDWGDLGINPPSSTPLDQWSPLFTRATDWEGCQVHHEDANGLLGTLFLGVNQSAAENTVYKVAVSYQVNQWNESAWAGCGEARQ